MSWLDDAENRHKKNPSIGDSGDLDHALKAIRIIRSVIQDLTLASADLEHMDPSSYSSMLYWREEALKARSEVERLRSIVSGANLVRLIGGPKC